MWRHAHCQRWVPVATNMLLNHGSNSIPRMDPAGTPLLFLCVLLPVGRAIGTPFEFVLNTEGVPVGGGSANAATVSAYSKRRE